MISICYLTCRKEPRLDWFYDSLLRQLSEERPSDAGVETELVIVDTNAGLRHPSNFGLGKPIGLLAGTLVLPPKPCIWQGPNQRTKHHEYFAASNARNTAMIAARGDYLLFVDDLSVLMPGWLSNVLHAYKNRYLVLGAYKKVRDLVVEDGIAKSWTEFPEGIDSRWNQGGNGIVPFPGSALFGCSFGVPLENLIEVNGSDEICDSCGGEDTDLGMRLARTNLKIYYNRNMLTLEDEGLHHVEPNRYLRIDPPTPGHKFGNDLSHILLNQTMKTGRKRALGNNFELKEGREKFQFDGTFPPVPHFNTHPITGVPLEEM